MSLQEERLDTLVLHKDNPLIEVVPLPKQPLINREFRKKIIALEEYIKKLPGAMIGDCFPLKHSFAEGVYIRELIIPKGMFVVGKLHRNSYVNCFMEGDMTILTEEGTKRIKAPITIVSPPETKRFGYSHKEVVWVTVHPNPTNETNIEKLEKKIHIDYNDLEQIIEIEYEVVEGIFNNFVKHLPYKEVDNV